MSDRRIGLWVIFIVSALRMFLAAHAPLTNDEAYYWVWSKHLDLGYLDHPPAVAWLGALGGILGGSPLAIRFPFILAEALAAYAAGRAAALLSGNAKSELVAVVVYMFIPQGRLWIGEALPDGPYLLCWALALWAAAAARISPNPWRMALAGLAAGGALNSRFFGFALLGGVLAWSLLPQNRLLWKRGFWLLPAVALLAYAPFIWWNAAHSWANMAFTLHDRQAMGGFSVTHLSAVSGLRFDIFGLLFLCAAYFATVKNNYPLLAWTAVPFPLALMLLSFFQTVESYYILGPLISLCVGVAIWYARWKPVWKGAIFGLAALSTAASIAGALVIALPESAQAAFFDLVPPARSAFSSQSFSYRPLAADVSRLARERNAVVLSDRFEIASELVYNGVEAQMIGDAPQVRQWRIWSALPPRRRALLVTFAPAPTQNDASSLRSACPGLREGPVLRYRYAQTPTGTFYAAWCDLR